MMAGAKPRPWKYRSGRNLKRSHEGAGDYAVVAESHIGARIAGA